MANPDASRCLHGLSRERHPRLEPNPHWARPVRSFAPSPQPPRPYTSPHGCHAHGSGPPDPAARHTALRPARRCSERGERRPKESVPPVEQHVERHPARSGQGAQHGSHALAPTARSQRTDAAAPIAPESVPPPISSAEMDPSSRVSLPPQQIQGLEGRSPRGSRGLFAPVRRGDQDVPRTQGGGRDQGHLEFDLAPRLHTHRPTPGKMPRRRETQHVPSGRDPHPKRRSTYRLVVEEDHGPRRRGDHPPPSGRSYGPCRTEGASPLDQLGRRFARQQIASRSEGGEPIERLADQRGTTRLVRHHRHGGLHLGPPASGTGDIGQILDPCAGTCEGRQGATLLQRSSVLPRRPERGDDRPQRRQARSQHLSPCRFPFDQTLQEASCLHCTGPIASEQGRQPPRLLGARRGSNEQERDPEHTAHPRDTPRLPRTGHRAVTSRMAAPAAFVVDSEDVPLNPLHLLPHAGATITASVTDL